MRDVATMILKVTNHKPEKMILDTSKPEGPFSRALDITRAKDLLGWEPKVHLEVGLRRTAEWHSPFAQERITVKSK